MSLATELRTLTDEARPIIEAAVVTWVKEKEYPHVKSALLRVAREGHSTFYYEMKVDIDGPSRRRRLIILTELFAAEGLSVEVTEKHFKMEISW